MIDKVIHITSRIMLILFSKKKKKHCWFIDFYVNWILTAISIYSTSISFHHIHKTNVQSVCVCLHELNISTFISNAPPQPPTPIIFSIVSIDTIEPVIDITAPFDAWPQTKSYAPQLLNYAWKLLNFIIGYWIALFCHFFFPRPGDMDFRRDYWLVQF